MSTRDDMPRTPQEDTGPHIDETYPDEDSGGNQERAYAAREPREVLREAHEALDRATERHAQQSDTD